MGGRRKQKKNMLLVKAKNLFEGDYFLRRKKFKSKDEKKLMSFSHFLYKIQFQVGLMINLVGKHRDIFFFRLQILIRHHHPHLHQILLRRVLATPRISSFDPRKRTIRVENGTPCTISIQHPQTKCQFCRGEEQSC